MPVATPTLRPEPASGQDGGVMPLPSGVVTLMFTDIEGSTRLLQRAGPSYPDVLRGHHAIVREAIAEHGGHELRTYGDAFFIVFAEAVGAAAAAAEIQRRLATHQWPGGFAVRTRIGLHTGEPRIVDGDYVGIDVHQAARISDAAHGGQVILGEATRNALGEQLPEELDLIDLDRHRLSDLSDAIRLFQLAGDGLASRFPPLRTLVAEGAEGDASTATNLFGRDDELGKLERVLTDARLGSSSAILLSGEPGIGKTALLRSLTKLASSEGMEVLTARGVESEAEVPFGGLLELLRPILDDLDRIPGAQAEALRGALDLGPTAERDRFLIGAATLNLLSTRSERAPLAVVIDDAHWIDDSSLAAVLFAARRLLADPVAVIFAARSEHAGDLRESRIAELELGGVGSAAAAAIIARHADSAPPREVAEQLGTATGGNPLALVELAANGTGLRPGPVERILEVETSIAQAYGRRISELPAATRKLLALAAAEDSGRLGWIDAAARQQGLELADLQPAEREGLVSVSFGELAWRHPLMRSAAYRAATGDERRAMHAALARVLPASEADRCSWHRAAAALGPDEEVANELDEAGARARSRSAYAAAATAAERAAQLSPTDEGRERRLFRAAEAAWLGGQTERALASLDAAYALATDPRERAEILHLRGQALIRVGDITTGRDLLIEGATAIEDVDPGKAVVMLAEATDACSYAGRPREMLVLARRAMELLPDDADEHERFFADLALGTALISSGEGDEGARRLKEAVAILESADAFSHDPRLLPAVAVAPLWLREAGIGTSLIERAIEESRRRAALGALPFMLALAARDAATSDRWALGRTLYEEAISLARESGQSMPLCGASAGLAIVHARAGDDEACEVHAHEALDLSERHGLGLFRIWALDALADLELGRGRLDDAVRLLEEKQAFLAELDSTDPDLSGVPELVEADVRGGRGADLVERLEAYATASEAKGQPWALARLARARGLMASDGEFEGHFTTALERHAAAPDRFEAARTQLCFGERLRRAGQRVRAREQLRASIDAFEELGAEPWADRGRTELLATGERARKRDPSTLDDLTPQELQICMLLAGGQTTREAASKLFLSPKTIEYHLRNAYRKLGIHSRQELAEELARSDLAAAPSA
jgi:class 3 adenylate cyclase/DNA-binding CsgD family transcriptional regulator